MLFAQFIKKSIRGMRILYDRKINGKHLMHIRIKYILLRIKQKKSKIQSIQKIGKIVLEATFIKLRDRINKEQRD